MSQFFLSSNDLDNYLRGVQLQMTEHSLGFAEDSVTVRYVIASVLYGERKDPEGDYTDTWAKIIIPWIRKTRKTATKRA